MNVLGKLILQEFWKSHGKARKPLQFWIRTAEDATWNCFSDIRKTFNHADSYSKDGKKYVIFNIAGNKYRLIAMVKYANKLVVVNVALTHKDYDNRKWKAKL